MSRTPAAYDRALPVGIDQLGDDMPETYVFTCGYCERTLDTPYASAQLAADFAQLRGWRVTYGPSPRWGDGANNTCPDCIPVGADPKHIHPIAW